MKLLLTALAFALTGIGPAIAQESVIMQFSDAAPADYPGVIPLGTGRGQPREDWFRQNGSLQVRNVSGATLTPFLPPAGAGTGAAVIVAPGGAFLGLAIEEEGFRIAQWLADHGVAAFVLKYRVLPTPADPAAFRREVIAMRNGRGPASFRPPADTPPEALADGLAAMRLVRVRARDWGIDPNRVGMMGFSAGAFTTLSVARAAAPDAMPAFIAPIYGRFAAGPVPAKAPPLYAVLAADDPLFAKQGFGLVESWLRAGIPAEFHLYQSGGHGFGLGKAGTTTVDWIEGFRRWLQTNGFLKAKP
ncbi:MAG: alpha/beta hydrolase [Novosphingobium sp.]